ncbi:MAG: ribosome recycling factor [Alphaproteobacteria bacterium]|nr:ribosome recycling factor [Alphaproteobacteria bacterium]
MSEEFLEAMNEDMDSALDALARSLNTVRTGRASPALIEGVQVDVSSYGARMPLNQLATISAPDPRLLVVSPWDKTTLSDIEKAITVAGLGLNPSSDGSIIRVPIPALTGERRRELARLVGKYAEEAKVQVRRVRKEYNDTFKQMETDKEISEDELKRLFKKVQDATDESVAKVDAAAKAKEKEISEV